jgi:hypothetical protein
MEELMYRSMFLDLGTSWRLVISFTPQPLTPGERVPITDWIRGWLGPRIGLDDVKRRKILSLPGLKIRFLGCPAGSPNRTMQSLVKVLLVFSSCYMLTDRQTKTQVIRAFVQISLPNPIQIKLVPVLNHVQMKMFGT